MRTSKNYLGRIKTTLLLAAAMAPGVASAGAWSLAGVPSSAPVGGGAASPVVQVQFTGDGSTFDAQTALTIPAGFTATVAAANGGGCQVVGTQVNVTSSTAVLIPAGPTTFCNITYTAAPATAAGNYDITTAAAPATGCFDSGGTAVTPCTPIANGTGALRVVVGPSGPALAYNPAANTAIAVPASISGTAVTSTIAVTQTGGDTGQTTTLACTAPAGYTATVTGSPFAPGGTGGSIGLACSGGAAAGNLTCTETRSGTGGGAPVVSTWPLTCASAPGFNSTPADGGTLSIVGIQGSVTPGAVAVSNPGTAALTISGCAVTGAGFTLGTVSATVASGGTGSIGVSCAVPPTAGTTITGTLQCNTNAAAPADVINYNLSCLSQSASIPTLGLGGKALMVLLMLGFGLVGFQLYRRSA